MMVRYAAYGAVPLALKCIAQTVVASLQLHKPDVLVIRPAVTVINVASSAAKSGNEGNPNNYYGYRQRLTKYCVGGDCLYGNRPKVYYWPLHALQQKGNIGTDMHE
jgi:hypothetical protein